MKLIDAFPAPSSIINNYVWYAFNQIDPDLASQYDGILPFFPISDTRADEWPWQTKPYVIYDQLVSPRRSPFYIIRKNRLVYVVKGTPSEVIAWSNAIATILDRQDAAAQDVNQWIEENDPSAGVFFHRFKVMQIDAANENRMDLSTNQKYLATIVIEYDYHLTEPMHFD